MASCTPLPAKYPQTDDHVFEFERNFEFCDWKQFVRDSVFGNYHLIAIIYLFTIYKLQRFMELRKEFELRIPLFVWNCSLAIFSMVGSLRGIREYSIICHHEGLYGTICNRSAQEGASGKILK